VEPVLFPHGFREDEKVIAMRCALAIEKKCTNYEMLGDDIAILAREFMRLVAETCQENETPSGH
jgi:hypothetical protein